MREDRGWIRFPAVDVRITLTPIMHQIIELLPNEQARRDMLLTGRRVGGKEAAKLHIVDAAYPQKRLFPEAMELARMLAGKDRKTYCALKHGMRWKLVALRDNLNRV